MPNCYPYETYSVHTWSNIWGTYICPNTRAAIFWAPLERFSEAKRNLPEGHRLIPWVAAWIPYENIAYDCPPPSRDDCWALIQHLRLRGADGYYNLCGDWNPNYTDNDDYRMDIRDAWKEFDSFMVDHGVKSIINLETDKIGGIQLSGVRNVNNIKILISNLSDTAQSVNYPAVFNLPAASPTVDPGEHLICDYSIINLVKNPVLSPDANGWFLGGGTIWQATGGFKNGPCLRFQGNSYAACISTDRFRTEPGALMHLYCAARGSGSPVLKALYYNDDENSVTLGVGTANFEKTLNDSLTGYASNFRIPDNPEIKYIRLIFYNQYGGSDPDDVIYLGIVSMNFAEEP